jgi:hypothetical protein
MPTILTLTFVPREDGAKSASKNYDILAPQLTGPENKFPLLISNQGAMYLKKGLVDPKTVKTVTIHVTTD